MRTVWIGTFPAAGAGTTPGLGEGIWHARLDADGSLLEPRLVIEAPAPTFLGDMRKKPFVVLCPGEPLSC